MAPSPKPSLGLFDAPAPCPPGAQMFAATTRDGKILRAALWRTENPPRGTVLLIQGRAEWIEKYGETIAELLARDFCVMSFDWRGQGGSQRLLRNRAKGHLKRSTDFRRDLDAILALLHETPCPKPWFALAHSMGAAALLDHEAARRGPSPFSRIVGLAPMIALAGFPGTGFARRLTKFLCAIGLGRFYVPGGGGKNLTRKKFAGNLVTSDEARFARAGALLAAAPELEVGDPTLGWTRAAYRLMARLQGDDAPEKITTPVLLFSPGADLLVSSAAVEDFAEKLKSGAAIVLPGARHEILSERDKFRALFWAGFDAFVPGEALASSAVQNGQGLLVDALVAGGDDRAATRRIAAVPGGDDPASAPNDRDQRDNVIGVQPGLDHQIDMAGR